MSSNSTWRDASPVDRPSKFKASDTRLWYHHPILTVRERTFTRMQLVQEARCGNFIAASRLNRLLAANNILSLADLNRVGLLGLLRIDGVGERAVWVAASVLDAANFDVNAWFERDGLGPSRSKKGAIRKGVARAKKATRRKARR